MLICKFRRGPTWFLTSTLRRLGIVLEFWREDQFRLHEEFHYHIKFGTLLWGMCRSQFWEHKLYLYYMITKIVSSWGGNLIIILHDLWRMAPFCSQSAPWEIFIKAALVDFTQQATTQCIDFCTTRFCERYLRK